MKDVTTICCELDGLSHYYGTYACYVSKENVAEIEKQVRERYPGYKDVIVTANRMKVEKCFSYKLLDW